MEKISSGLEIVKKEVNTNLGYEVVLTRKTNKQGHIKHGVVVTNTRTGCRTRLKTFHGISGAYKLYKTCVNA